MTQLEMKVLRKTSYKPPPEKRCDTCEFKNYYSNSCFAVEIRGRVELFKIDPAGVCDLWTKKKER